MTTEETTTETKEQAELETLNQAIEAKKEEIKEKFALDDEQFNVLIRNVILDSFDKLRIRLSEDDPIFAVILSQKSVMDYYALMITKSLNSIPKQISYTIDDKLEQLSEGIKTLGEALDKDVSEFKTSFNNQAIDVNNQIITSFNTFIDKKMAEIKAEFSEIEAKTSPKTVESPRTDKSAFNALMFFFLLVNIAIAGLTLYTVHNGKDSTVRREQAYQMGLFKGFEKVRKILPSKEAEKVESTIIEAIDNELKTR
ncbi:hypothetical protein GVX81_08800 [[Haemophilus] felis]|uniref:Uncharacterized protein n=1 Tax=[Haemophilus] felis TaxID=123822 RepID=A0A1T0AXV7_9PAST|nr:hypothetical protein [[Haemophilus] felis]OOS02499.1 hypothetical protein B0188_08575 [[Haemophilus] felis]